MSDCQSGWKFTEMTFNILLSQFPQSDSSKSTVFAPKDQFILGLCEHSNRRQMRDNTSRLRSSGLLPSGLWCVMCSSAV